MKISTSERKAFQKCQQFWYYTSPNGRNLTTETPPRHYFFGIGIHAALADFYDPATPRTVEVALESWHAWMDEQEKEIANSTGALWGEEATEFSELRELGEGMLTHYAGEFSPMEDHDLTCVWVEKAFSVRIKPRSPYIYQLRPDALFVDSYDNYWIGEWKAQPLDALVLTPHGWVKMGDLNVGDAVIGSDGQPTKVVGVHPQGEKEVFQVRFRDGSTVECSNEHLWTVRGSHSKVWRTKQLKEIIGAAYERWQVPLVSAPVSFAQSVLPIPGYLLGALLGNGYLAGTSVQFSTGEREQADLVRANLPAGLVLRKAGGENYTWTITFPAEARRNPLKDALRDLGLHGKLSRQKFIPEPYMIADEATRLAVLQGLLDTDGNIYQGKVTFTSMSLRLAEGVRDLARSLGGTARISGGHHHEDQYDVRVRLPAGIAPFRLARKREAWENRKPGRGLSRYIESIVPLGITKPMQCISVENPDGLYVTNDYVLTHNTAERLYDNDEWLELDDQSGSYIAGVQRTMGIRISGVLHTTLAKNAPKPLKVLKNGNLSRDLRQATTYNIAVKQLRAHYGGHIPAEFNDLLTKLGEGDPFVKRVRTRRNQTEIAAQWGLIEREARQMRRLSKHPEELTRSPSRFNCQGCFFRQPCIAKYEGSDEEGLLRDMFVSAKARY